MEKANEQDETLNFIVEKGQRYVGFYSDKLTMGDSGVSIDEVDLPFTQLTVQFALDWLYKA